MDGQKRKTVTTDDGQSASVRRNLNSGYLCNVGSLDHSEYVMEAGMKFLHDNMELLVMIVVGFMTWGAFMNALIKCELHTHRDELSDAWVKLVFMLLIFTAVSALVILIN